MHISHKPSAISALPVIQKYIFNHMAATAGWFIDEGGDYSSIHISFSDGQPNKFEKVNENQFRYNISEQIFNKFLRFLKCEDRLDPEMEPPAHPSPVLDEIAADIKEEIIDFCKFNRLPHISKCLWPGGKDMAISITHDIDITRKYGLNSLARDFFTANFTALADHFQKSVFRDNVYWNFEELLQFYRDKKIVSTFYFISRPWEKFHYRYNVKSSKFRQLFEAILSDNHEIGLHTSRFAFDHPYRIGPEKKRLENLLQRKIQGVRQHYLRLLFPKAWDYFEESGFLYDSSSGYNDSLGFRAGTSLPFRTYNFAEQKPRKLYEIPFSIMDYPWKDNQNTEADIGNLFKNISDPIEKNSGLLNLIWHPHNIVEEEFYDLWSFLLTYLESKKAHIDCLYRIIDWWEKRFGLQMKQFGYQSSSLDIKLYSASQIENICLDAQRIRIK
jgi:hypothetical protein